jgi:hypothetical protein
LIRKQEKRFNFSKFLLLTFYKIKVNCGDPADSAHDKAFRSIWRPPLIEQNFTCTYALVATESEIIASVTSNTYGLNTIYSFIVYTKIPGLSTRKCNFARLFYGRETWSLTLREDLSLLHFVQTVFGTHPASYPMGTVDYFPGDNAAGA